LLKLETLGKVKRRVFHKLGGDIVPLRGDDLLMILKIIWFLDIFYNGLTERSRSYLDNVAGNIFRHKTGEEAKELLNTINQNYNGWHIEEEDKIEMIRNQRGIHNY
jgi:hypothetical protein